VADKFKKNLLEVNGLKKYFSVKSGGIHKVEATLKAVDGVSFNIKEGETLGLVGESGCGKTTTGRTILQLLKPTSGEVKFEGKNIASISKKELRKIRNKMQIIFQDPYASLDPRMKVIDLIGEPLDINNLDSNKKERIERIKELMNKVSLSSDYLHCYPYEFSGGQRQRIGIARALALNPKLIICDEPVSALDVSIQAQIINLMQNLQSDFKLTYLFIAHDLSVVKHISDKVAVMYLGKIVEMASKKELYNNPLHPYTQALISAVPIPDPNYKSKRIILKGDIPSLINPPFGCHFHPRCIHKVNPICSQVEPKLKNYGNDHFVSCHLMDL